MNRIEEIRIGILTQCYAQRPDSRTADQIAQWMRREGEIRDMTAREIAIEADYLRGRGWLEEDSRELSQAVKRWKISADGINYLEREGWV